MRAQISRARGLLQRYRVDRRLPPAVLGLFTSAARLRRDEAVRKFAAATRRVLGASGGQGHVARLRDRRLVTHSVLDASLFEQGHRHARRIVEALEAANIVPFLVARREDGLEFGIEIEQRQAALLALATGAGHRGVYLAWEDGRRSGLVELSDAASNRHARRARCWNVFTAFEWAERAIGETAGTRITFWEIGTSAQREKIGTRGQERFHVDSPRTPALVDGHEYPGVATFPIGRNFEEFAGDIDIVYTWVDGSDPEWQASFEQWADLSQDSVPATAFDPARFRSRDELRYSLRSVWAYCGWARNIYIVTSGQVPSWLVEDERVRVVTHSEILPAAALPTFNSHSIESALHRIEGLAEHFVYLNDDVFIGRPLRPEAFFTVNGLPLVFQSNARVHGAEYAESLAVDTAALRARSLLDQRFGRVVSSKPLHAPFPLLRSVIEQLVAEFPDAVQRTEASRFRAPSDLSIAASFASHYALGLGRAVLGDISCHYVYVESDRLSWSLDRIALGGDVDAFCINETKDSGQFEAERENRLRDFFDSAFPVAAPWERVGGSET
jgi:hypothetical protein